MIDERGKGASSASSSPSILVSGEALLLLLPCRKEVVLRSNSVNSEAGEGRAEVEAELGGQH